MAIRLIIIGILSTLFGACSKAQIPTERPKVNQAAFDKKISSYLSFTVPLVGVEDLKKMDEVLLVDTRKKKEYQVSHIPGAIFGGYSDFDIARLGNIPKDKAIVVYCSIGYRSEKIGEKLQKAGFSNVSNLYGSIFEWANQGNPLEDQAGNPTKKIHTYNKKWSRWLEEGKGEKVW